LIHNLFFYSEIHNSCGLLQALDSFVSHVLGFEGEQETPISMIPMSA
jgi:hypothetical protein